MYVYCIYLQAGDRIRRPQLAKTLELLAESGPDIFYNGSMTDSLVNEITAFKGIITREDFRTYKYVAFFFSLFLIFLSFENIWITLVAFSISLEIYS